LSDLEGIAARLFAARGFKVTGVEPNEAMRGWAEREGGGVAYVAGQATATGLPPGSAARDDPGKAGAVYRTAHGRLVTRPRPKNE